MRRACAVTPSVEGDLSYTAKIASKTMIVPNNSYCYVYVYVYVNYIISGEYLLERKKFRQAANATYKLKQTQTENSEC